MLDGGSPPEPLAITHRDDGGTEEVEFFGDYDQGLLFGCRHVPSGPVRAGLVVCPPILADFGANYQREVRLGRRLAAAGVVVQRFHPRGAGQSDGDGADLTLDSMIEDTRAAVTRLRERFPVETIAVMGTRFGALAASAVAAELDGAPVVLWEPTTDPRRFFREGLRARSVHQFKAGTAGTDDADDREAELARCGFIDLLGSPVGAQMFNTPGEHDLATLMGVRPRPVLLVQFDQREELRDEYHELVDRWTALGFSVTARCSPSEETWWYVHDRLAPVAAILDTTADWLVARLS
jgi:pimeloyl-ACP methyl ester carboxylesterase